MFDDYTWRKNKAEPYSDYNGKMIPSRVPLTALISGLPSNIAVCYRYLTCRNIGPMAGGEWDPGATTPLSVTTNFFEKRCPNPTVFKSDEVSSTLDPNTPQTVRMEKWVEKLKSMDEKCVEIDAWSSSQIFDFG